MKAKGIVFSGMIRGQPVLEQYYHRIIGLLGFEPYRGTLNIKLQKKIDMKYYATKKVSHVLMDGKEVVNLWLAPVNLLVAGEKYECWAMQQSEGGLNEDVIELLAKEHLKQKFNINDRDNVEVEFFELTARLSKRQRIRRNIKAALKPKPKTVKAKSRK